MDRPNTYCPLCGVILRVDYHDWGLPFPPRQRPWFAEVRGIAVDGELASITGLEILYTRSVLSAPLDREASYQDDPSLEAMKLFQPSETRWGFACHDACWRLLLARLSLSGIDDEAKVAGSIVKLLHATPCPDSSCFNFGHDYGGATATHESIGLAKAIDPSSPFYADSFAIPSLDSLEASAPKILFPTSPGRYLITSGARPQKNSGFGRHSANFH